ncbi:hypothetical protein HYDPIDRAFT_164419 [Hydnomerulius pinastri MD-312]|nr:hypothetical protein HYDPIDRAFT_164419 [Hydnomerulius pinastri MD-312]
MYNGIGLTTARGSGTNGYVQRNLSTLRVHETAADRAAAWEVAPPKHREPDEAILEHEKKRKVEVKCLELQLQLEDEGLEEAEIEAKVDELRTKLNADLASLATSAKNLKPSDTHGIAAAKKAELDKMARALGTRKNYAEGEAFDREKQEENKIRRQVERDERDRKRDEERAKMREQRQKWEAEKKERDRLRRREEDRIRKEREQSDLRRKERMPPPSAPSYRDRNTPRGPRGGERDRRSRSPRRSPLRGRERDYGRPDRLLPLATSVQVPQSLLPGAHLPLRPLTKHVSALSHPHAVVVRTRHLPAVFVTNPTLLPHGEDVIGLILLAVNAHPSSAGAMIEKM